MKIDNVFFLNSFIWIFWKLGDIFSIWIFFIIGFFIIFEMFFLKWISSLVVILFNINYFIASLVLCNLSQGAGDTIGFVSAIRPELLSDSIEHLKVLSNQFSKIFQILSEYLSRKQHNRNTVDFNKTNSIICVCIFPSFTEDFIWAPL